MPAKSFQFGDAIGHDDGDSSDLKHFEIVMIVTDGENFITLQTLALGPFGKRAAFGAFRRQNVNHGEIARVVKSSREGVGIGERSAAKDGLGVTHFFDRAGEHDLNGILGEGIFERGNDADVVEVALVVGIADGIVLDKRFEHDLVFDRTIKDDGGALAPFFCGVEDAAGNVSRKEMAEMSFAVGGTDDGAVVDDHGEGAIELAGDGHGEIVAAAGDEGDFDAAASGCGDGGAVGVRELPAAVQERAVDIERDEADGHSYILP